MPRFSHHKNIPDQTRSFDDNTYSSNPTNSVEEEQKNPPHLKMPPKNLHNTYHPPPPSHLRPILICGAVMFLVALPFPPSSSLPSFLTPSLVKALRWSQAALFYFLYGAHAVETAIFTKRLRDAGIEAGSAAWCKWMATCFVGGKFCFDYFDGLVGKA